jgi:hypothetical protein
MTPWLASIWTLKNSDSPKRVFAGQSCRERQKEAHHCAIEGDAVLDRYVNNTVPDPDKTSTRRDHRRDTKAEWCDFCLSALER